MASYRGHLTFAGLLGAGYGSLALLEGNWDWGSVLIAAGLTTLGGLLPDLDSDSGVPVRELFGVSAAIAPILLFERVKSLCQQSTEQTVVVLAGKHSVNRVRREFGRGRAHVLPDRRRGMTAPADP